MKHVFLINGYGVPKDIRLDFNYQLYLRAAFNAIYSTCLEQKIRRPLIILSGGHTDCWPPYRRTEGQEMAKAFTGLAGRSFLRHLTRSWRMKTETKSISTLENFLFSQKLVGPGRVDLVIFCEQTRVLRVKSLAPKVFGRQVRLKVQPIDFDVSANRYLQPQTISRKETIALAVDQWARRYPQRMPEHHQFFRERLLFLRQRGGKRQAAAVAAWYKQAERHWPISFRRWLKKNRGR